MSLATSSLRTMSLGTIVPRDNCSTRQLFLSTIVPLDNCSSQQLILRSFTKRTVLRMTKIKGTEERRLLQMIIHIIRPPLCSFVPLQMIICKEGGSQGDQNQGDEGDGVVANDHPENPPFLCKWSFAKRIVLQMANIKIKGMEEHRMSQMTIWIISPPPCSSVKRVICKEDGPPDDQQCFGRMGLNFAPDLLLVWRIQYKISAQTDQMLELIRAK